MHNKGLAHSRWPGCAGLQDTELGPMNQLRLSQETMGKIRFSGGNNKRLGSPPPQRQEEVRQFWKVLWVGGHGAGALVDSKLGAKQVERAIFLARCLDAESMPPPSYRPSSGKRLCLPPSLVVSSTDSGVNCFCLNPFSATS